ncbi:MAG: hypothetical protein HZB16_19115 [Armatimonadetes bacterium]|nr:hypothetical protein [Armatimonadota bacterium]
MGIWWLLCLSVGQPRYANPLLYPYLPPALEDRLVYYRTFDAPGDKPEVDALAAAEQSAPALASTGLVGKSGQVGGPVKAGFRLAADGLSPHGPLTVMFWWQLPEPMPANGGYSLCQLNGRGYISVFGRGGPWCGLSDTAAVLQIWNLPGIPNINNIYDGSPRKSLTLDQPVWHHTALTVAGGRMVRLYTDGQPSTHNQLEGRPISPDDQIHQLELGSGGGPTTRIDELMVLARVLDDEEIAGYVRGVRALLAIGLR